MNLEALQSALRERYQIVRELGRGGMAVVYLANDLRHKRQVAIKVLHSDLAGAVGPQRFLREIETAARLTHPHIVPLFDSGEAAEQLYYVMPFIEGESLRARLTREHRMSVSDTERLTEEIAGALDYAHRAGVVHRDIKPENILLHDGHALVADFGIALALARATESGPAETLTQTGFSLGTPSYMSPEQSVGERELDGRSDQYALACVVYEMLAGVTPFTGSSSEQAAQRFTAAPPKVTGKRSELPAAIDPVLARALSLKPQDRFPTAREFALALEAALGSGAAASGVDASLLRRKLPRSWTVIWLVLFAAAAAGGSWWFVRHRGRSVQSERRMLAVLPFKNLGRPEDAYFADGLTEEITNRLAGVSGLGVISRTTTDGYRNTTKSLKQVARELSVRYVLEGSVRWDKSGGGPGRVRVTPQLIRVDDDTHLWADDIDAELRDVFRVQSDVASRVAGALDVALQPSEQRAMARSPTTNLGAYEHYLRAIAYEREANLNATGYGAAVQELRQSVALDPKFAAAHASLARMLIGSVNTDQDFARLGEPAKAEALEALRLDPGSAEAHVALGYFYKNGHPDRALEEFNEAVRLRPSAADAVHAIARMRWERGEWREALSGFETALRLNPKDFLSLGYAGRVGIILHDYENAARRFEQAMQAEPDAPFAYLWRAHIYIASAADTIRARNVLHDALTRLGIQRFARVYAMLDAFPWVISDAYTPRAVEQLAPSTGDIVERGRYAMFNLQLYLQRGDTTRAKTFADSLIKLASEFGTDSVDTQTHVWLGLAYAVRSRRAEALGEISKVAALASAPETDLMASSSQTMLARTYLILGDRDAAIRELERALRRSSYISGNVLRVDPSWLPLRQDPRFVRLASGQLSR